jgi:hypothetical protein
VYYAHHINSIAGEPLASERCGGEEDAQLHDGSPGGYGRPVLIWTG